MTEHYLDDLLREMMSEAEVMEQKQGDNPEPSSHSAAPNPSSTSPTLMERRKSRVSHHESIHSDFDYLETLLNDMSVNDQSIRKSVISEQNQNARVKSLRLTSQLDLESTLNDLEAFYKDNTLQSKRKQSSHLSRVNSKPSEAQNVLSTTTSSPPSSSKIIDQSIYEIPKEQLQVPSTQPSSNIQQPTSLTASSNLSASKRTSPDKVSAIAREAIDAADLLDQMIESFGTVTTSTDPSKDESPSSTIKKQQLQQQQKQAGIPVVVTSGTGTIRPAAKLGAPVDIAVSSPKPPTPIATLSASPLSLTQSSQSSQNSDKMLDEMISLFKETNSTLKFASPHNINNNNSSSSSSSTTETTPVKPNYLSQQHYTMTPEDAHKIHMQQKQQQVDEDLVQKILCENDFDEMEMTSPNSSPVATPSMPGTMTEKAWYIKQDINTQETIGFGNHGTSSRAGIHKEKRIIGKSWTYITPQATPLLFNEIEQLISIKHPNILSLIGASITSTFNTFSEYITGNNLDIILRNVDERNELSFIVRISEEIASAMSFLHSFNIVHRSLHPKNILLNSDLKVYIKDYGFASLKDETIRKRLMSTNRMNGIQHSQYIAPELFNVLSGGKGGYDTKVDVFSFGVMLWEMFGRDIKLSTLGHNIVNGYTYYSRPSLPNCPFTIDKLIRLCVSSDPNLRPSFQTILKVLRQPLHTLQRFTKPENSSSSQQQQNQQSMSMAASLDTDKLEKVQRIFNLCKDLVASPVFSNLSRASQTLESLTKNQDNHPYLLQVDVLPLIFECLNTRFEDVQLSSLKSISQLLENDELSELFRNLLGINTLIQLLTGQRSDNIIFASIRALQQLCHKDVNVIEVMSKGGIPILIQQLSHPNELVRLQIVWCLTMLLEQSSVQDEFIKMGGVEILLDMFVQSQNDGFNLRVASALSRLLSSRFTQDMVNQGGFREKILEKYLSFLDSGFEALRMLGLEALAILVTNADNQEYMVRENVLTLLIEFLDVEHTLIAPQMTAIKIILVLSSIPKHHTYVKSQPILAPITKLKLKSPHPSIQKASEKIVSLLV